MPYKEIDIADIGKIKIYKRRGNRSLRLTVAADGTVRVTMPTWAPYNAGAAFAASRRNWIIAHSKPHTSLLTSGQQIGKTRRLFFEQSALVRSVKTNVRSASVVITHRYDQLSSDEEVQAAAQAASWRALRSEAQQLLGRRLEQLATVHGFSYRSLAIKRMKTRWGSCDQHANIVLNLFLVQLPWEFIDYVILHELAHTRALNHGPDFWHELEAHLPGARSLKRQMKDFHPTVLTRAELDLLGPSPARQPQAMA